MRRVALPLLAGVLAASATFVAVAALDRDDGPGRAAPAAGTAPLVDATPPTGRSVFARMGCGNCHELAAANARGRIGPNLDGVLGTHTRASLRAKILDPYPGGSPGDFTVMPEDFGSRMSAAELDALVSYLLAVRRPSQP
jgi:mono/diheme cytochrome c family protein